MMPVTQELLDDLGDLRSMIHRRLRIYVWWAGARNRIMLALHDRYGTFPDYPPHFDAEALRPPLPYWPRPR